MPCRRRALRQHQNAALIAEMLSLPNDGRYPALVGSLQNPHDAGRDFHGSIGSRRTAPGTSGLAK